MLKKLLARRFFLAWLTLFTISSYAQNIQFSGVVKDKEEGFGLPMAYLALHTMEDTALVKAVYADTSGSFIFKSIPAGVYLMRFFYFGYQETYTPVDLFESRSGYVFLANPEVQSLDAITLKGRIPPVEQKGDTTVFNAGAYKTLPNADAEDLVKKMPGIEVKDGEVKAQGETVTEIFIDGKPFFGNDPNTALKTLPAEIIDKVEVLDKGNEQSQFTGFDDGDRTKAINIVTKKDRRNGKFGKAYLGYGTEGRYQAGGNLNIFNGSQRISILGISNNINQQNFSSDDLGGISGGGRSSGTRRRYRRMGEDFQTSQLDGITMTNSLGINFMDSLGKKVLFTGSYFYNRADNSNNRFLNRNYFLPGDSSQVYNENNKSDNLSQSHRVNMRIEYKMDSSNSFLIVPRINIRRQNTSNVMESRNLIMPGNSNSSSFNDFSQDVSSYQFRNDALYMHAFSKKGRSLSIDLETEFSKENNSSDLQAINSYTGDSGITSVDSLSQKSQLDELAYHIETDLRYTEPLGKYSQLMFSYELTAENRDYNKETFDLDSDSQFSELNTELSGDYISNVLTNEAGIHYKIRKENLVGSFGFEYQNVHLNNDQTLPSVTSISKSYNSILPRVFIKYNWSKDKNFRLYFRSGTDVPSISQLNNVLDNSNPILVSQGNPNLEQEYNNRIVLRGSFGNSDNYRSLNVFAYVKNTMNYIGNSILIPGSDTLLSNGYTLRQGAQLTTPENLDGHWNIRSNLTYSFPLDLIKSNVSLSSGYNYIRTPGLINDENNFVNNHALSQGINIGSNFSENLEFNLGYTGNYSIVNSLLQPENNQNYFFHTVELKTEYIFWKGFLIQSNLGQYLYRGLSGAFNQDFLLWNLSFGKKLFKDQKGELRLSVFDVLNQNNSISRNVSENYVEDVENDILNRYFMLTFTYNFRKF